MFHRLLATTQQIELEKDSIEALHRETNSFLDDLDNFDTFVSIILLCWTTADPMKAGTREI